jgi:hypothetical protein
VRLEAAVKRVFVYGAEREKSSTLGFFGCVFVLYKKAEKSRKSKNKKEESLCG